MQVGGTFCHNTIVRKATLNGAQVYAVFHIGDAAEPGIAKNCTAGACGHWPTPARVCSPPATRSVWLVFHSLPLSPAVSRCLPLSPLSLPVSPTSLWTVAGEDTEVPVGGGNIGYTALLYSTSVYGPWTSLNHSIIDGSSVPGRSIIRFARSSCLLLVCCFRFPSPEPELTFTLSSNNRNNNNSNSADVSSCLPALTGTRLYLAAILRPLPASHLPPPSPSGGGENR